MRITKEDFEKYLKVQFSGKYNMFDALALRESGLDMDVYIYIMSHYGALKCEFAGLYDMLQKKSLRNKKIG